MNAFEQAASGAEEADHGQAMDRMYRLQRHVYDATRKYYLLGRDQLVADLCVPPGGQVLEMGCGTGRNLLKVARHYPLARVYGIDISSEMLKTAQTSLAKSADRGRIAIACADATDFDPAKAFGVARFDRVFFSYTLSMIPDWQTALAQAFAMLSPDGELHIVDFGQSEGLPRAFRAASSPGSGVSTSRRDQSCFRPADPSHRREAPRCRSRRNTAAIAGA